MSENIESLTRSLTQILSSLSDYISKKNSSSFTENTSAPKIKKTSDMTYMNFLVKVLSSRPPVEVILKKQSYNLQEDL